ncbi:MAG: hypothetical protein C4560_07340 [Nitrospiraceae bacterium]|nr:MAG: hypothetical protein C4560_07340 [Nitrospiraceae bacterium]
MFRFLFRTILFIVLVVFLSAALAVWKGGEPFRWLGGKTVNAGRGIEKFGDYVDDLKKGGRQIKKTYESIKDAVTSENEKAAGKGK